MKSIKQGRGPSFMNGIGSFIAALVGIAWTVGATQMGAPVFFSFFGVAFTLLAIGQGVYQMINATGKKRFSLMDITTGDEEPDPLNEYFGQKGKEAEEEEKTSLVKSKYCPECGGKIKSDYEFCPECGTKQP